MALSKGDDYPIHQTPEPVAYAGTDRNFYDRYFFNGYAMQGSTSFFAAAFGVYPHLNIADAAFVVVRNGVETALHASRMPEHGADGHRRGADPHRGGRAAGKTSHRRRCAGARALPPTSCSPGRIAPIEEPRFIRRIGPRTVMDYTRLTQNGRYQGWIELDGVRESIDGFVGTRDRSWGVRPVGARDPQALAPKASPQFFWLWSPTNFESASLFFHSNDDAAGVPWNRRAVWAGDGKPAREFENASVSVVWRSGTRHAAQAVVKLDDGAFEATFTPIYDFFMLGLGYGHPKWAHGLNHGEDAVEREDIVLNTVDVRLPHHLHIQALCDVTCRDDEGRVHQGRGVLEQLVVGPHAPSGFKTAQDFAP